MRYKRNNNNTNCDLTHEYNVSKAADMDTTPTVGPDVGIPDETHHSSPAAVRQSGPVEMDIETVNPFNTGGSDLSTRLFVSDEQRRVKQQFEEKQRDEARRLAHADKLAQKKVNM